MMPALALFNAVGGARVLAALICQPCLHHGNSAPMVEMAYADETHHAPNFSNVCWDSRKDVPRRAGGISQMRMFAASMERGILPKSTDMQASSTATPRGSANKV